jgi:DNA repair exonuclease SbcCD ATPase subunit
VIDPLRRKVQAGRAEMDSALSQTQSLTKRLQTAKESHRAWLEAQAVLQDASAAVQSLVHARIADVVTKCLQTVYDDSLSFHVDFEQKRGKTEARLYFRKDNHEVDPLEAGGLGWVEVGAFALRLAVLKLHSPPVAQIIVADEPFRMLDAEAKPRMAELLLELSKQMGVQIILVSHDKEFRVGKVISLT